MTIIFGLNVYRSAVMSFEVNNFKASNGWISNFKKRHNMKEYVKWGEAASAPLEILDEERRKLREIIKDYDLNDVFNCDETGEYLFFRIHMHLFVLIFFLLF